MPAPLSIVIPTLNASRDLPGLLQDLMPGIADGLVKEVILTDGGSEDAIYEIADMTGAVLVTSTRGRGIQLRAGAVAAKGDWLFFVHADTRLPDGWVNMIRSHMTSDGDHAAFFRLKFRSSHPMAKVTAAWANLRSRVFGLPYGDQGLLISTRLYRDCGGYPAIPLMEDVAIARQLNGRLKSLRGSVSTSAERYDADGWLLRGTKNLKILLRYLLGASPAELSSGYSGTPPSN